MDRIYFRLVLFAAGLAFVVVLLGAFTRLSDAGLGCPDWPGCYGHVTVPHTSEELKSVAKAYPSTVVEKNKAWAEMIHRYFAGSLGALILILAVWALIAKKKHAMQPLAVPLCLLGLVIFQAALGMWTVTWKLLPLVVMGHLLGGMLILGGLWWLYLSSIACKIPVYTALPTLNKLFLAALVGLVIVALQIFLGGWTSSNYAAIICPDFPTCNGQLFPNFDFARAFNFFSPIGANYQGGALAAPARITIQMLHRYGGAITGIYVGALAWYLMFFRSVAHFRALGWIIFILLITQVCLGVLNVVWRLPLVVAVAHNATAALLLLSVITLVHKIVAMKRSLKNE